MHANESIILYRGIEYIYTKCEGFCFYRVNQCFITNMLLSLPTIMVS